MDSKVLMHLMEDTMESLGEERIIFKKHTCRNGVLPGLGEAVQR
jgi:hypothetical protein